MSMLGKAAIISWNNVAPDHRAEFRRWHSAEHLPERLAVLGFVQGRRHAAVRADRDFLIDVVGLYKLEERCTERRSSSGPAGDAPFIPRA